MQAASNVWVIPPMNDPTLLLRAYLEDNVVVTCKDMDPISCTLHAFDEHLNILVSKTMDTSDKKVLFIRGETVIHIKKKKDSVY